MIQKAYSPKLKIDSAAKLQSICNAQLKIVLNCCYRARCTALAQGWRLLTVKFTMQLRFTLPQLNLDKIRKHQNWIVLEYYF